MQNENRRSLNLGRWIHEARSDKGISVVELAARVDREKSYLHRIEAGQVPSKKLLLRIAEALGMDEDQVLRWLTEASYPSEPGAVSTVIPAKLPHSGADQTEQIPKVEGSSRPADDYTLRMGDVLQRDLSLPKVDVEHICEKVARIIERVAKAWGKEAERHARYIPCRGPHHSLQMIKELCANFKPELKNLDREDLRLLLTAIWLHDIGLTQKDYSANLAELEKYHEDSAGYVDAEYLKLGLSDEERKVISALCRFHRNIEHVRDLELPGTGTAVSVERQQALLALLRLAALMEVRQDRVREWNLLPFKNPIPLDLECELLRNLFVTKIYRERQTLVAELCYNWEEDRSMIDTLNKRIEGDLQGALDQVQDALVANLNLILLRVRTRPGPPPKERMNEQISEALRLVSTSRSPNASRVIDTLLTSLGRHLAGEEKASALADIQTELDAYRKLRFYQAQIPNLIDDLQDVMKGTEKPLCDRLNRMTEIVQAYRESKDQAYVHACKVARKLFDKPARFVVYGYSKCVLEALGSLDEGIKTRSRVYIFECRPKSHHALDGSLQYCDGIEYAREFSRLGYGHILLTPDGSASFVMTNRLLDEEESMPTYVVLGAEGIDTSGEIHSTIGTMPVILAANNRKVPGKVPVYVLAEGSKIRPKIKHEGLRNDLWLTSAKKIQQLEKDRIQVRNLVNEKIPGDMIEGIIGISDEGPVRSTREQINSAYNQHREKWNLPQVKHDKA